MCLDIRTDLLIKYNVAVKLTLRRINTDNVRITPQVEVAARATTGFKNAYLIALIERLPNNSLHSPDCVLDGRFFRLYFENGIGHLLSVRESHVNGNSAYPVLLAS